MRKCFYGYSQNTTGPLYCPNSTLCTVHVGNFQSNFKAIRNKNCVFLFVFLIKTFPTSVSQISSVTGAHDPIPNRLWPLLSSITHLSRLPMPCSIQMKKNLANFFFILIFFILKWETSKRQFGAQQSLSQCHSESHLTLI